MKITEEIISSSQLGGNNIWIQFKLESDSEIDNTIAELRSRVLQIIGNEPDQWNPTFIRKSILKLQRITQLPIEDIKFSIDFYEGTFKVNVDWHQIPGDNHALFARCKDSSGNIYKELLMDNNEKVRFTQVQNSWNGGAGIRIQIRQEDGHLRQGPEIPIEFLGDVIRELKKFSS